MRKLLLLLLLIPTDVGAQNLRPPVQIKQETTICQNLGAVQYKEMLIREERTESLSNLNSVNSFTGQCATARAGQYMFYEGFDGKSNGKYVCMRQRSGSDCWWLKAEAVGEIPTNHPSIKVGQAQNNIPCASWEALVKKSYEAEKAINQKWAAQRPKGDGNPVSEMAQGMLTGMLGMVTGGPDSHQYRVMNACQRDFRAAQELARRITAYRICPKISDKLNSETDLYQSLIKELNRTCLDTKIMPE